MIKYISSVHNEQIKHLVHLQQKQYRYEHGQFVIEGMRACTHLFEKYTPVAIYITQDYYTTHPLNGYEEIVTGVSDHVMAKISTSKTPSGICTIFAIPEQRPLPQQGPGLVLMNVSDPGNMGTLIRTAAAMDIREIIIIDGVDPYNSKVIQATAGCLASVNLYPATLSDLAQHTNLQLCGLVVKDGKTPDEINLKNKFLVVGNEAHGLSTEELKACHEKLTIPMPGHAESLNAAIAGAIGLYLMMSQK